MSRLTLAWLVPRPGESGRDLARRTQFLLVTQLTIANLVGAGLVYVLAAFALPFPAVDDPAATRIANLIAACAYLGIGVPLGTWLANHRARGARRWLESDRPPTPDERRIVLLGPRRIAAVHALLWSVAAGVFGVLNATYSLELGQRVAMTVLMSGFTTCAIVYLITERRLRPTAARALADGIGARRLGPGIKTRTFMAFVLGTAVPFVGVIMVALSTLTEQDFEADELANTVLVLAGIGLTIGFAIAMLAARAVADPVVSVSRALRRVEEGDLEVEVPVYDGSEIGQLQAGFNRMVEGLRERERIHDLFGRHVGEDVARAALDRGVELGGETREVSVLFIDLVGSTQLASQRPPDEVVAILNDFFAIVVAVAREHGGWINKFEGDAALAVFGAPVALDDHADRALATARELCERLERELPQVEAGIGVSTGDVVAGNIGEEQRFEYTVIGDPVNEAARLTELAKTEGGVLASDAALARASEAERDRWETGDAVELRGRGAQTRLAKPVGERAS